MTRISTLFAGILLVWLPGAAQTLSEYPDEYKTLDGEDLSVSVHTGGDMSWDLQGDPGFEVPKGSGKHTIFAANLWIGGLDESGGLRMAAHTYRQSGIDFWPGPKADQYDSSYFARYGHVWSVSQAEIAFHRSSWQVPNYVMPEGIAAWPGNGDTTNGEPWLLAPFVDENANTRYEPELGEYPAIAGDEALYLIYSDAHYPNTETGGANMQVDVHTMLYVYTNNSIEALDQAVFVTHKIVNRSNQAYQEVHIGEWVDFDIGRFNDDLVGCDTSHHAFFGYNADDYDGSPSTVVPGSYEEHPPAQAVMFLNQELTSFAAHRNDFTPIGNPELAPQYYGYMRGFWKNGTPFTINGDGYGGTTTTKFLYPGDPRDSTQWSLLTQPPVFTDWKSIGSTGPFTLNPGQSICLEMAFVFGQSATGNHLAGVSEMFAGMNEIRHFSDTTSRLSACSAMDLQTLTDVEQKWEKPGITDVFPNPAKDLLTIRSDQTISAIRVLNLLGQTVYESDAAKLEHQIPVDKLADGVYLVEFLQGEKQFVTKILVRK